MKYYNLQKMEVTGTWQDTGEACAESEINEFMAGAESDYLEEDDMYFFIGSDGEDYRLVPVTGMEH